MPQVPELRLDQRLLVAVARSPGDEAAVPLSSPPWGDEGAVPRP